VCGACVCDCGILKLQFMPAPAFPASAIVMMAHFYGQRNLIEFIALFFFRLWAWVCVCVCVWGT